MVRIHVYGFLLFFNIYFLVINGKLYIFADKKIKLGVDMII